MCIRDSHYNTHTLSNYQTKNMYYFPVPIQSEYTRMKELCWKILPRHPYNPHIDIRFFLFGILKKVCYVVQIFRATESNENVLNWFQHPDTKFVVASITRIVKWWDNIEIYLRIILKRRKLSH